MSVGKALTIVFLLFFFGYRGYSLPPVPDYLYLQYALDGVPLAIFESSREDEVTVLTDAASMIQVRWGEGVKKLLPIKRGVRGAFQRPFGGFLVWFEDGEIEGYNSFGSLVHQLRSGDGELRLARETRGGYTVVERGNRVELYGLGGNKLLEWKREGVEPLPIQISEEDLVLDAESSGGCIVRRVDGTVLTQFPFPHPLRQLAWIQGRVLMGISLGGKVTTMNLEGKEIGSGVFLPKNLGALSSVENDGKGNVAYIDPEGNCHLIFSRVHLSIPLDLKGAQVRTLGFSRGGTSLWVGDSRWVLHWIRASTEGRNGSNEPPSSPADLSKIFPSDSFAEQYYQDLAQSTFPLKNIRLIEETKESLRRATLRGILPALKKGLRTLVAREEAGASLRGEGVLLLGRMGDRFDGEWLGKRLLQEKDPAIRSKILEALQLLANAPPQTAREDLFTFLGNRKTYLSENDLRRSLDLLERWIFVSGIPLRPEELEQLSSLAALSPSFSKAILEFIRK
jgi:hypothetical protein